MIAALALIVPGLALLSLGADRLVLAAARLARVWGLSPILIGALVVGMGTSAPEFLVSVVAAARDDLDIAAGNVIGSNVANLSLVLGAAALVAPIAGQIRTLRREGGLMLVAVALFAAFAWDQTLTRGEGAVLAAAMLIAATMLVVWARRDGSDESALSAEIEGLTLDAGRPNVRFEVIMGLLTLGATLGGAELLVRGAQRFAAELGLSAGFVGLTLVALGTSLPELATAMAAARRREHDLVVGNLLGSNIFNSLAVAGGAALVGGGALAGTFRPGLIVMLVVAALAALLSATGNRLVRWEGALLLATYAAFIALSY